MRSLPAARMMFGQQKKSRLLLGLHRCQNSPSHYFVDNNFVEYNQMYYNNYNRLEEFHCTPLPCPCMRRLYCRPLHLLKPCMRLFLQQTGMPPENAASLIGVRLPTGVYLHPTEIRRIVEAGGSSKKRI